MTLTLEIPGKSRVSGRMRTAPNRERQLSPGPNHPNQASDWRAAMQSISKRPTVEERFWSRVDKDGPLPELRPELGPCWIWTHTLNIKGYSSFRVPGVGSSGHRYSYTIHVGPIPDGLEVDHLCSVRACVNPRHLEAVTHHENILRGRTIAGINKRKTQCVNGHEFTPENTYEIRPGQRACEECRTIYRVKARLTNKTCAECGAVVRSRSMARHRKLHQRQGDN